MSATSIPDRVKVILWGRAAGRCEYDGCNEILWRDDVTSFEFNSAYIAHIVADKPTGPRGDKILSEQLSSDINNLMLMCDKHHRLIDKVAVEDHPVHVLKEMKRRHEERIELLTGICENKRSQIVLYGANTGEQNSKINDRIAKLAIIPERYPTTHSIELSTINSADTDGNDEFWEQECRHLERQYESKIHERLSLGELEHLSIFGFAPQALLIKLGTLITDKPAAQVFQLHREPQSWRWKEHKGDTDFLIVEPEKKFKMVALKISLSAKISDDRVLQVLGDNVSIWEMTSNLIGYDVISSKEDLSALRQSFRKLYAKIKEAHGQNTLLNVFPVMPVSAAIEFGRVRNPKADVKMVLYDQHKKTNMFHKAIHIE